MAYNRPVSALETLVRGSARNLLSSKGVEVAPKVYEERLTGIYREDKKNPAIGDHSVNSWQSGGFRTSQHR